MTIRSSNMNLLKEVGYILLLITFFVGVLIGSFSLKNVDSASFNEYSESLENSILGKENRPIRLNGFKDILIFWIVGMSIVGTPILIFCLGYKGFSLGYTISTVIRLIGTNAGNKYIFQNLFLENTIIVFIMIFLANYSIKISKHFFEKKENIKVDAIKYTIIATFMAVLLGIFYIGERMFFALI